jgi:drug/metabolite transporter (DMT)-like permease
MNPKKGIAFALLAVLLWSAAGFLCTHGLAAQRGLSSLEGTFVRIVVNLVFVLFVQFVLRGERRLPWGSGGLDLWAWGCLGALTIVTYFASIQALGPGEATLLQGVQGLVVAALAPFLLGQRSGWMSWAAIGGGLFGLRLSLAPSAGNGSAWEGRALALASGVFAGLAYLLLSAVRGKHRPDTISFYWCLVSLLLTLGIALLWRAPLTFAGPALPWLLSAGLAGSLAQWFTTLAYQTAPAAPVASTAYLIPLLSLAWESMEGARHLHGQMLIGAGLVLISGLGLPYLQARRGGLTTTPPFLSTGGEVQG